MLIKNKKKKQFGGQFKHSKRKFNKQKFKGRKHGLQQKQFDKGQQQQEQQIENFNDEEPKQLNYKYDRKQNVVNEYRRPLIEHVTLGKWYDYQFDEICQITKDEKNEEEKMKEHILVQNVQKKADNLLLKDVEKFMQWHRARNRGDADWIETVEQKGTFSDRLSALQLSIQRSPVHAIQQLSKFVAFIEKKGAKIRQAYSITKVLKDLYLNELLPPLRKLVSFNQRPLEKWANEKGKEAEKRLILWNFEAQLKQNYHQFLLALESLAGNAVEGVAQTACKEMTELLIERSEQEQFLLSAIVNKLGHPQHRVGGKVAQMLEQLVHKHPNMRPFVTKEVEKLIFRKNISPRAQRYGLHFLTRMLLDAGEFELALQLIQVYLRMFRNLILNDTLNEHRLLPLLVSGLNRAFPYAKGKALNADLLSDMDSLYAILQTAKFSTALSVLRLIFQIHTNSEGLSDRFYCAFYRRLLNLPTNGNCEQMAIFFDLTQKILKNDLVESRVRAFLKRLFQIALTGNSAFAAATLLTCHSIIKEKPKLLRLDNYLTGKIIGENQQVFINLNICLIFKSDDVLNKKSKKVLKMKTKSERKKEKLEEEIEQKNIKKEAQMILERKMKWFEENNGNEEEEEECYVDVKLESDEEEQELKIKKKKPEKFGWMHRQVKNGHHLNGQKPNQLTMRRNNVYDPNARNPLFAGTDFALDTELYALARHYHPTVSMFATAIIRDEPINYNGDPLVDLSHMRFLDRHAFKNPKTRHKKSRLFARTTVNVKQSPSQKSKKVGEDEEIDDEEDDEDIEMDDFGMEEEDEDE